MPLELEGNLLRLILAGLKGITPVELNALWTFSAVRASPTAWLIIPMKKKLN